MTTRTEADWEEFGNPAYEPICGADIDNVNTEPLEIEDHERNLDYIREHGDTDYAPQP